jgi:hypothetical protein
MRRILAIMFTAAIFAVSVPAHAQQREIKLGIGVNGPISGGTEAEIENIVGALPNIHRIPIVPPGGVEACVKRYVAGDLDDRLDGVIVVSLPTDTFQTSHDEHEARFTGSYEIWTLNLSTLAEDRHRFTFTDSEPVVGTAMSILAIPAQLFVERATGSKLISSSAYQAYQAVQARVEAKLIAATKLYLQNASIRDTGPLNMMETAQSLLNRGDGDTAMAVFKVVGIDNPVVKKMIADAQDKIHRAAANALLGRTIGAMAGGNSAGALKLIGEYEKNPDYEPARASAMRRALAAGEGASAMEAAVRADVPALDQAAFVAMIKQLFADTTSSTPSDIVLSNTDMTIEDKAAPNALKTDLDRYAAAMARGAWLMSIKCGCDAGANLTAEAIGAQLLHSRNAPGMARPQVGLP